MLLWKLASACAMRRPYSITFTQSLHAINDLIAVGWVGNLLCGHRSYFQIFGYLIKNCLFWNPPPFLNLWVLDMLHSVYYTTHLYVGAPGIFSVLLRSLQMLKRDVVRKATEATAPIQSLVKLQPCFVSLSWRTCLRQHCSLRSCVLDLLMMYITQLWIFNMLVYFIICLWYQIKRRLRGQEVSWSPPTAEVSSLRLGHSMWLSWWTKWSLARVFYRFSLPQFHSTISPHSSHSFVSFHLISSAPVMMRHVWSTGILAIQSPSI